MMADTSLGLSHLDLCRLCGQAGEVLFRLDQPAVDEIQRHLPLQVCPSRFPAWLCPSCRDALDAWVKFRERIHAGQWLFTQRLHELDAAWDLVWPAWIKAEPWTRSWFSVRYPVKIRIRPTGKIPEPPASRVTPTEPSPGRRTRKIPMRFAEGVPGQELEAMLEESVAPETAESTALDDEASESNPAPVGRESPTSATGEEPRLEISVPDLVHCDVCAEPFDTLAGMQAHKHQVHRGLLFLCEEEGCRLKFKAKSGLMAHQSKYPTHQGFQMIQIQKSKAKSKSDLKAKTPPTERLYVCSVCNATFKQKHLCQRHERQVHSQDRPFPCPACPMKFKSKTNLMAHQRTHTGEKKYCCELCAKVFSYKTSLTSHMRWHEGLKPFKCEVCSKSFTQKGNLQEHARIHTGEKPFACQICGKTFTTYSQNKLHEKRHSGEKPWKCEFCCKSFLDKDTWKIHVRRHKGEKPFGCDTCQKSFAEGWALKKHKRSHTGERPYKCETCLKSFSDQSNLTKHRRQHTEANQDDQETTVFSIIQEGLATDENMQTFAQVEGNVEQIIYIAVQEDLPKADDSGEPLPDTTVTTVQLLPNVNPGDTMDLVALPNVDAFRVGDSDLESSQVAPQPIELVSESVTSMQIITDVANVEEIRALSGDTKDCQDHPEDGSQIVDIAIKDGPPLRLKVPINIDPQAFVAEYLQSLDTTESHTSSH